MSCSENRQTGICHLLRLPAKVHERIFHYLFSRDWDYCEKLQITGDRQVYLTTSKRPRCLAGSDDAAILRTCKLLHDEGLPVLYECSKFIVTISMPVAYPRSEEVEGLPLGSMASTKTMWRNMKHLKLIVRWEQHTKKLVFTVHDFVNACRDNMGLSISELKIEGIYSHDGSVNPILICLARLRYPEPPRVWFKFTEVRFRRSPDVSLEDFLTATGGRDVSNEFETQEDRLRFPHPEDYQRCQGSRAQGGAEYHHHGWMRSGDKDVESEVTRRG
ncbi:hypothetical protein M409DRAFT_26423 [Zasmidium cellare ATCC 36951]|uniref:F-box domain-containing protein n=1 Tax=Zasmidium cellare ATCC 36951 TaxID=1080233 RepID=A0A6A6C867_ZASCE|nr:uncharacterized protein M409DRAFT_26423 [Zasmidium cellare ATCC 36951]KAF2163387.1 hypothetical protein M409DRAFT_26423 [Zasmidium cellare ATCC 36951]